MPSPIDRSRRIARFLSVVYVVSGALLVALALSPSVARAEGAKHGAATAGVLAQESAPKTKAKPAPRATAKSSKAKHQPGKAGHPLKPAAAHVQSTTPKVRA
jgi:hypothetical protein